MSTAPTQAERAVVAAAQGLHDAFRAVFGADPEAVASAPGRVNLLGDHTDYNGGFVLPVATPQQTRVAVRRKGGDVFRLHARELRETVTFTLSAPPQAQFARYVYGCLQELGQALGQMQKPVPVPGSAGSGLGAPVLPALDLMVASEVPMGVGLSSSAALEVATLRALRQLLSLPVDDVQIAQLGQRAESLHAGVRCGILDQMASSLADIRRALLLDTRSLARQFVDLPVGSDILVLDSGLARSLASSGYNQRRAECEEAARRLGVTSLRDVLDSTISDVAGECASAKVGGGALPDAPGAQSVPCPTTRPAASGAWQALPDPLNRRVRHVLTENARVLRAIGCGSAAEFGALMNASHASLRDDYEVSVPALDRLVDLLQRHPRVHGARLTGAGFGGACVALCQEGSLPLVASQVLAAYAAQGGAGRPLVPPGLEGPASRQ